MSNQAHQDKLKSIAIMDRQQLADEAEIHQSLMEKHRAARDVAVAKADELNIKIFALAEELTGVTAISTRSQLALERSISILNEITVQERPNQGILKGNPNETHND